MTNNEARAYAVYLKIGNRREILDCCLAHSAKLAKIKISRRWSISDTKILSARQISL